MLLLDKESLLSENINNKKITIISDREQISVQAAQLLRTRGLENVEIIAVDFFNLDSQSMLAIDGNLGVIIDIKQEANANDVFNRVYSIVPQNIWCCLIGDSDSISLAQRFVDEGMLYFHSTSQLELMVERIVSGVNIPRTRHTVKIMVLSCKGGIGASFISAHIADAIATDQKVPVLLAQGNNGSQDLDLMFDRKIQNDIVENSANLHLFKGVPSSLPSAVLNRYNFIIYDQPIFNFDKEKITELFTQSNNFILVVDRRLSSLRMAKNFLDECNRVKTHHNKPLRTFVCVSDHKAEIAKSMVKADVERLIGHSVDAVVPFLKQTMANKVLSVNLGRQGKKVMSDLSLKVIGMLSRKAKKENKSLVASILSALTGKK